MDHFDELSGRQWERYRKAKQSIKCQLKYRLTYHSVGRYNVLVFDV